MIGKICEREDEIIEGILEIAKIPSASGCELKRARYIQKLMSKYKIKSPVIDLSGNVVGKIKGIEGKDSIVITAHLDTCLELQKEIKLTSKMIKSTGVGSQSLALYVLVFLGELLTDKKLEKNIYLVATVEGETTLAGMEFFLENVNMPVNHLLNLDGVGLGKSMREAKSVIRLRIMFYLKHEIAVNKKNSTNLILSISNFVQKIQAEELLPSVSYDIVSINSGKYYSKTPLKGSILMELKGESMKDVEHLREIITSIAQGMFSEGKIKVKIEEEAYRVGNKLEKSETEEIYLQVLNEMGIPIKSSESTSQIEVPLSKHIDAISIGLADSNIDGNGDECIYIKSFYKGIESLVKTIENLDKI